MATNAAIQEATNTMIPLKVLLVEDSEADRVLYQRLLRKSNTAFDVTEADSVAAGLRACQGKAMDCVVLDYHLPDGDGIEFINSFEKYGSPETAIIMVTGQGNEKTAVEAMKLGALDYITKNTISEGYFVQSILNAIERSRLRREVQKYQADLEKSNQSLTEFTHIVSHDLKAPLRRIKSYCELIEEETKGVLPAEAANYVSRLGANVDRLQHFVDDLLAFSRVMHAEEERKTIDLNVMLKEVLEDLEPLIEENHARVMVEKLPTLSLYPLRIQQVFQNLVSNAIKYRGKDDPVIEVSYADLGTEYEFSVKDNGMGIPAQYQQNIFKAFQRLHAQDQIEGTGLGLSIVQKVAAMHGGKVGVK